MKKILGTLGVTLIIAVSFFNMSSVVDANQNVDLASILQNANADSEDGAYIYHSSQTMVYPYSYKYYSSEINDWCEYSSMVEATDCFGTGTKFCEATSDEYDIEDPCGYGGGPEYPSSGM